MFLSDSTKLSKRLTLDTALVATHNDGEEELISVVFALCLVQCLYSSDGVLACLALAKNKALESNLNTLPSLITVHGVVPADNGRNLTKAELLDKVNQLLHVASTRLGVGITAVTEEVDENLGDVVFLGGLEDGVQVRLLGVLNGC